jgi:hypothetical protein
MKNLNYLFFAISFIGIVACSSSKKTTKADELKKEPIAAVVQKRDTGIVKPVTITFSDKEKQRKLLRIQGVEDYVAAYPDSLLVAWERSGCYGRCPIYKVRIYNSGYTEYEAVRWTTKDDGLYSLKYTEKEISSILEQSRSINFFEMKSFYDTNVSDMPSYFVCINDNGNKKGIRDRRLGPAELKSFITDLDSTLVNKSFKLLQLKEE